jgi:hypothetical protein
VRGENFNHCFKTHSKMPYESPLHILDSLQISPDEISQETIIRIKQKLLSEFNLNSAITITINGKDYTKDAILKVIDELKETDNLTLDKDIFIQKPLLNWLENPIKESFPNDLILKMLDKNKENDSLQNIIKKALNEYIKFNFKKIQFAKIKETLSCVTKLKEQHNLENFELLGAEIQQVIELIEVAKKSPNPRRDEKIFGFIATKDWTDLLNSLPSFFENIRDLYCRSAIGYALDVIEKSTEWTYQISNQVNQTLCDQELKEYVSEFHEAFTESYQKSKITKKIISFLPMIAGFVVLVVLITIILMIISKNNNSSDSEVNESVSPIEKSDYSSSVEPIPVEVEMDTSKRGDGSPTKFPAKTFYAIEVIIYKKNLLRENWKIGGIKTNILTGEEPFGNMDMGNSEEEANTKYQLVEFKNETNYDLVVMKMGSFPNRSYFIRSNDVTIIKFSLGDKLCFYFGKEWVEKSHVSTNGPRFQGYFSSVHKNTNDILSRFYTVITGANYNRSVISFDNEILENNLPPKTKDIVLIKTD